MKQLKERSQFMFKKPLTASKQEFFFSLWGYLVIGGV